MQYKEGACILYMYMYIIITYNMRNIPSSYILAYDQSFTWLPTPKLRIYSHITLAIYGAQAESFKLAN
jgi:hypothetical protein